MKHFIIENCEVFKKDELFRGKSDSLCKGIKTTLKDIEVITEIENIQRLEIIKVKENIVLQMITMHRFVLKLKTTFLKYKMYFMILMNALLN